MPAASFVEAPQIGEQTMHGGVEMNCLLGDLFTEGIQLFARETIAHEFFLSRGFRRSCGRAGAAICRRVEIFLVGQ